MSMRCLGVRGHKNLGQIPQFLSSHVSRKILAFELQSKCVDTQADYVDTTGSGFRTGFWEGQGGGILRDHEGKSLCSKVTSGDAGGGGILRDHEGNMYCAFAKAYHGLKSSLAAEVHALRDGISMCCRTGASEALIETDSLNLLQIVTTQLACPWDLAFILQDIAAMTQNFKAEIIHAPRETNKVADCLAGFALSCTLPVTWDSWADLHTAVKELYNFDKEPALVEADFEEGESVDDALGVYLLDFDEKDELGDHGSEEEDPVGSYVDGTKRFDEPTMAAYEPTKEINLCTEESPK
ncbi:hypothetical protein Taro_003675, partial [Colocasia esculenta]|nr:hypothetical protein [Colocasia esculenta]